MKRLRSDAERNERAILAAARDVFAESGVDAPIREIAKKAGVGVGTLYRRFPSRADLVVGVMRQEMDACVAAADDLSRAHPPVEALARWLRRYAAFIGTKAGLSSILHSGDPSFAELPAHFKSTFEPALERLLADAVEAGQVRDDVDAWDLLRGIGNLSTTDEAHTARMLSLLIAGLAVPP